MAAVEYFLKIEGIKGESHDDKHKDEIDVQSFSWGVSQTGARAGGGGGAGKVQFQDFHFANLVSKASPSLFLACASGEHIKQAVFVGEAVNPKGEVASPFFKYTFTDVLISSYAEAGQDTQDTVQDAASFAFASVKAETTPGAGAGIPTSATGNIAFDATGQLTIIEGAPGLLTSGPVFNTDGILIGLSRGIVEFDLSDVLGLVNGPSPHMRLALTVREVRTLTEQPPVDQINAEVLAQTVAVKPKKRLFRHKLFWYGPTDLELTTDDFDRQARRFGRIQLDPEGDPAEKEFDVTRFVRKNDLTSIGFRIQAAMDLTHLDANAEKDNDDPEPEDPLEVEDASADDLSAGRPAPLPSPAQFMLDLELFIEA
jgi:type VI secretion system secreted protein Hcp